MTQTRACQPLPITAMGAATVHGDRLATTFDVLANKRPILPRRRDFIGADFKPIRAGVRRAQDLDHPVQDRIRHLADCAILDLAANPGVIDLCAQGIAVIVNLPEQDTTFALPQDLGEDLARQVGDILNAPVTQYVVQRAGNAGPGSILGDAMSREWDGVPVVLLAVDSMASRGRLAAHLARGDLLSDANPYGVIPGEAAVAMLLSHGNAPAQILGAGAGIETLREDDEGDSDYAGLSAAWWDAIDRAEVAQVDHLWTDWNNGRFRAAQMSYAMLRTQSRLAPGLEPAHVALHFGDTGAASQLLALAQALFVATPGETVLVSAHSRWSGAASAILAQRS